MKLSVIINTFNEGGRVGATCKSFLDAGADEVVVFADGTTDGSCDELPTRVRVLKSAEALGCGISKTKATLSSTGDVLMWVDAHQSVETGDIRATAKKALSDEVILCPSLVNIFYRDDWTVERVSNKSHVFYPNNSLLLPTGGQQYGFAKEKHNFAVGVGLCMSRKTYLRVGGWNQFKGRHGSQERGMALRALMAGVPVDIDDNLCLGHEFYGQDHPSRNSKTGQYRFNNLVPASHNLWHAYQTVLSPSGFSSVIAPWLESLDGLAAGRSATADKNALQDRDYFLRHCKSRTDEYLYHILAGMKGVHFADDKGGASLEPAAVHFIKSNAVGRCLELGTGSGKGTASLLEGAMEVVSIDHISTYSNLARDKIKAPNVKFITAPVKPNGFYDLSVLQGKFDLIVIDGPPGTKARRYSVEECLPFLAYGGCILADDANRDIEGIKDAVQKFNLKLEMLPTRRGLAKIMSQAAS